MTNAVNLASLAVSGGLNADANGNVGLGVTPSAWRDVDDVLQVGQGFFGGLATSSATRRSYMGSNYYTNASGQDIYVANGEASLYQQNNGTHTFYSATSGTAGNVATLTSILEARLGQPLVLQGGVGSTGTGIAFPAAQNASSNANTLDDYEEGTWTPSVGGTATYTNQVGKYTKIGNMVSIYCLMRIAAIGTGSTTAISGLPFTAAQRGGGGMTYWAGLSQAVDFLYPNADGTGVNFLGATAASANPTDGIAIFQGGAYVIFSATYFV